MKSVLIAALPALLLVACSSGGDTLEPGQWTMALNVTEANLPGTPPEAQGELRAELNRELAMDPICISAEQAAAPTASLFIPSEAESECDFSGSTVEGGVITISGTCGNDGSLTINGSYDATSMQATLAARVEDGNEVLDFTAEMTGERSGDCAG